jgi:hypothetical protein
MHRLGITSLLFLAASTAQTATTYRTTVTTKYRSERRVVVQRIIVDGDNRRLTVEHPEEPFTYDVLLSTDGGRTVTALNTALHTWFEAPKPWATATGLPPLIPAEIKNAKTTVTEEPSTETIAGFPVRKFVIRAGYTSREDYSGNKVNRIHTMTALLWTTEKLDRSLAFPIPEFTTRVESLDAELRQKSAAIPGFPLRCVTSLSHAYEGGEPSVEMRTSEVDEIGTVPPPSASVFVKPAGYVHQEPVIGAPGKM